MLFFLFSFNTWHLDVTHAGGVFSSRGNSHETSCCITQTSTRNYLFTPESAIILIHSINLFVPVSLYGRPVSIVLRRRCKICQKYVDSPKAYPQIWQHLFGPRFPKFLREHMSTQPLQWCLFNLKPQRTT